MTKLLYSDTKITLIKFLKKICDVILYLACWGERVGSRTLANIFKKMCVYVYDCRGVAHPSLLCRSSKRLHPTAVSPNTEEHGAM